MLISEQANLYIPFYFLCQVKPGTAMGTRLHPEPCQVVALFSSPSIESLVLGVKSVVSLLFTHAWSLLSIYVSSIKTLSFVSHTIRLYQTLRLTVVLLLATRICPLIS